MANFFSYIIRRFKRRAPKKTKIKTEEEKLKELLMALYQYSNWIDQEVDITPAIPIAKIEAIQRVYFPEFSDIIGDVLKAGIRYEFAKRRDRTIKIEDKIRIDENIEELRIKYVTSFDACIAKLNSYARREF